jgi:hypothetical protein
LRLPRLSSWFIWLSLDTLLTLAATTGPNLACSDQVKIGPTLTVGWECSVSS